MNEFFREFYDVYFQALEIMKERLDNGFPNNEGIVFSKQKYKMSVIFDGSFSSGWKSRGGAISNFSFSCIVAADRFSAMPTFKGRTKVGKFIIKDGDVCNSIIGDERCQIAKMWPSSVVGTTQWYGFSFMLDPTWTSNGQWFMLWEYGWPSEVLGINNNNQLFIKQYYSNKATTLSVPIVKDQWYDVLARIKLSYASDGIYEVFLRIPGETAYKQVHYSTGATAISNQLVHQLGPYRGGASTNTQIVYIADYKVGTTRADVEYSTMTDITNAEIKKGCGHLGELNHETHTCSPLCVWKDEPITHPECKNCAISLNLPVKRCYFEV